MVEAVGEIMGHKDGLTTAILALCVIFTVFIVVKVVEILWKIRADKDLASEKSIKELKESVDQNTAQMKVLDARLQSVEQKLENTFSALPKLKEDLRRYYIGLKILAGKKWATIRKEIAEDEKVV